MSMRAMMDAALVVTGLMRLCLVAAVFYFNCRALLVVCFRSNLCVHNLVSTAVVLANILYLITWPPFLIYGLTSTAAVNNVDGWMSSPAVNEQVFCLSQNYVVNAMGMVLLSLLVVRLTDRVRENVLCWPALGCTRNVLFTFLMWLLPQLVYDLVSLATNGNLCNVDGRRRRPVFHFLGEIVRVVSPASTTDQLDAGSSAAASISSAAYSLGFMVCEQELTDVVVAFHLWQYLVLVVPYAAAALLFGALLSVSANLRRRRRRHRRLSLLSEMSRDHGDAGRKHELADDCCDDYCRRRMIVVDLILYGNILWHLLGRPLIILHTLYWRGGDVDGQNFPPPTFLDVGSHLMLAVSCCFAPTICYGLSVASSTTARRSVVSVLHVKNNMQLSCSDCGKLDLTELPDEDFKCNSALTSDRTILI